MRRMFSKTVEKLKDSRGSAMVSVFLVLSVLMILGGGLLLLSSANAKQAKVADTYERAYFVAEGNARQAIETLRSAVLEKYRLIVQDLANNNETSNNAANFFAYIDAVTYKPLQPDSSAGGPTDATVKITPSSGMPTRSYTVVSKTKGKDGSDIRTLTSTLVITFVPVVKTKLGISLPTDALIAGGNIASKCNATTIVNGDVRAKSYTVPSDPNQFKVYGTKYTDPDSLSKLTWELEYADNYEAKTSATPSIALIPGGATVSSSSFTYPLPTPMYLEGKANATYTVSSLDVTGGGQFYSTGALTVTNGNYYGTSSKWLKLYSSGNMTISSSSLKYIKVFCGGDLIIKDCGMPDNMLIDCAGDVTVTNASLSHTKLYCGGDFNFSSNDITGDSIVYVKGDISFTNASGTMRGLFYAGGDVTIGSASMNLTGQLAAKGDITIGQSSPKFTYDAALMELLKYDPFVLGGNKPKYVITQPPDSQVFTNNPVYAEQ